MAPYFDKLMHAGVKAVRIEARHREPKWIEAVTSKYARLCAGDRSVLFGKDDKPLHADTYSVVLRIYRRDYE